MSLKDLMSTLSAMSTDEAAKDEALHKKHGVELGLTFGDPKSEAYIAESNSLSAPFAEYLSRLSVSDLKKLVTLMYAGRDKEHLRDAGSLSVFHNDLKMIGVHDKAQADYIRILMEKRLNLAAYYGSAKELFAEMGIDPDNALASVQ